MGAQGAAVYLPVTALSFMKSQPTAVSVASIQEDDWHEFSARTVQHLVQKSFAQVLGEGPHLLKPILKCASWQNTHEPHDGHQRLFLYGKPATLGSCNALFTFFFFQDNPCYPSLLIQKLQDSDRRGAETNLLLSAKKELLNYNA